MQVLRDTSDIMERRIRVRMHGRGPLSYIIVAPARRIPTHNSRVTAL